MRLTILGRITSQPNKLLKAEFSLEQTRIALKENSDAELLEFYKVLQFEERSNVEFAIWHKINLKKDSSSLVFMRRKYGESKGLLEYEKANLKKSSCWREFGIKAEDLYNGLVSYRINVDKITKGNLIFMNKCPGIRGKSGGNYQLDHIFSKSRL